MCTYMVKFFHIEHACSVHVVATTGKTSSPSAETLEVIVDAKCLGQRSDTGTKSDNSKVHREKTTEQNTHSAARRRQAANERELIDLNDERIDVKQSCPVQLTTWTSTQSAKQSSLLRHWSIRSDL